jgi:hypothetical protein
VENHKSRVTNTLAYYTSELISVKSFMLQASRQMFCNSTSLRVVYIDKFYFEKMMSISQHDYNPLSCLGNHGGHDTNIKDPICVALPTVAKVIKAGIFVP